jgi:phosphatidylserine decarboxylase
MLWLGIIAAAVVLLFLLWRFWFFFRNPRREIVPDDDRILSPADGYVIYARRVDPGAGRPIVSIKGQNVIHLDELMHRGDEALSDRSGTLVGVFMSPFDVHFNRAPIAGRINKIAHGFPQGGVFEKVNRCMFNALSNLIYDERPFEHDCEYVTANERATFTFKNARAAIAVTQIAERWIRRIETYKDGVDVAQGEVFGLIRMGSQVDVFVPDGQGFELTVKERQRVKAGLSTLFVRRPK